jgi:dTDP-4-amino-4,6-dideoxygalactose transaminase
MKIEIFKPPHFERHPLDIGRLNQLTGKQWIYAATGRASIYHILKGKDIKRILLPAYLCKTVLEPLRKLNIEPVYYDIDSEDLNPSYESFVTLAEKYDIKAVLVPSLYGNPADLVSFEQYCKENNIFMIDDAAQSFGAKLDGRYVGTFGDAGFFSFSPGKPTAAHMGSFFWSSDKIRIQRTQHCIIHYITWLDFYVNRYKIYKYTNYFLKKSLTYLHIFLHKFVNIYNDKICLFENKIIGGVLLSNIEGKFSFRKELFNDFHRLFSKNPYFKVIQAKRGLPEHHKIVLLFSQDHLALKFINYMIEHQIYVRMGYSPLANSLTSLPNTRKLLNRIIELPIENDRDKMNYLFDKVRLFYG